MPGWSSQLAKADSDVLGDITIQFNAIDRYVKSKVETELVHRPAGKEESGDEKKKKLASTRQNRCE